MLPTRELFLMMKIDFSMIWNFLDFDFDYRSHYDSDYDKIICFKLLIPLTMGLNSGLYSSTNQ
jgi:hypothetical protein